MSATTTATTLSAKAKRAFNSLKGGLLDSYGEVVGTGLAATLARIDFGGKANQAVAAMIAADDTTTGEAAQNTILEALRKAGFRVSKWGTIADWQNASEVWNGLDGTSRMKIAENGGVHALVRLRSVTAKDGKRQEFVNGLVKANTLTFDEIAEAVKAHNGASKPKMTDKQKTEKLVEKHNTLGVAFQRTASGSGQWSPEVQAIVTLAMQYGYRMARGGNALVKFEKQALGELSYFGPVADAESETQDS